MDMGIVIQTSPTYSFPEKDVETTHVYGRNGDVIISGESYQNVERSYSLASIFREGTNFISNSQEISKWLNSTYGYARLEDTYDPSVYRLAMYKGGGSTVDIYGRATTITATFVCKPQRFLKSGEKESTYNTSSVTIINPTSQKALPKIKISGLDLSTSKDIAMVTDKDSSGKVVSSITLTSIPTTSITLDSDLQNAYYSDAEEISDLNKYIGLNGKGFPVFDSGKNTLSINKYSEESSYFQKYKDVITTGQSVCKAKYQPYDTLVLSNQKKFYFKSFDSLKESKEESYYAEGYSLRLSEKAESYTFISYNTLLSKYGESCSFVGTDNVYPSWIEVTQETETDVNGNVTTYNVCKVNSSLTAGGYFLCKNTDNKILYHAAGSTVARIVSTSTITIYYYPAKIVNSLPEIQINYDDMPSWVSCEIKYNTDDTSSIEGRYPSSINYVVNQDGYFWKDKSALFSSASWGLYKASAKTILASVSWFTASKAFMSFSGLSTSTTLSFTFKYLSVIPQYEDVTETSTATDGTTTTTVKNKVHFSVVATSEDLSTISLKAVDSGYYRCNSSASSAWKHVDAGNLITDAETSYSKSNTVYYISSIPDYSGETDFPSDLLSGKFSYSGGNDINPTTISSYVVNKKGYYRVSHLNGTETVYSYSGKNSDGTDATVSKNWVYLDVGATITVNLGHDINYYIYYIEQQPVKYPNDMSFNDSADAPSWISVSYESSLIKYTAKQDGYYKWDSNETWVYMTSGTSIVSSSLKQDTTIYFMSSLAKYIDYDLYTTSIVTTSTGNPSSVVIKAKEAGYYRYNTSSDWVYVEVGDTILSSKVSDSNTVYHLKASSEEISGIVISIIPRWWML